MNGNEETTGKDMRFNNIPPHKNCRLCHHAGFSNLCTFSLGGECPYVSLRKILAGMENPA